jgi:hypothetical protein
VFRDRAGVLRKRFLEAPLVRQHFADPATGWDEAFKPNDGGIGYLARCVTDVCDPDTKTRRIQARLAEIRSRIVGDLERFHVSTDIETRRSQRMEVCDRIIGELTDPDVDVSFGSLLRHLQIDGGALSRHLYGVIVHGLQDQADDGAATVQRSPTPGSGKGVIRVAPGGGPRATPSGPRRTSTRSTWEARVAEETLRFWEQKKAEFADSPQLFRMVGLSRESVVEISMELKILAERVGLAKDIEGALGSLMHTEQNEQRISKAAIIGEKFLNRFVSDMGFGSAKPEDRPTVEVEGQTRMVFSQRPTSYGSRDWTGEVENYRAVFMEDWLFGFHRVVDVNAQMEAGITVDPELNSKLGKILSDLRPTV